jgi:hypothetical protein
VCSIRRGADIGRGPEAAEIESGWRLGKTPQPGWGADVRGPAHAPHDEIVDAAGLHEVNGPRADPAIGREDVMVVFHETQSEHRSLGGVRRTDVG